MTSPQAVACPPAGRLQHKVALLVGAASGIGRATAAAYAREGARVVVADLRGESARVVAADLVASGAIAEAFEVDVTDDASVRQLVERVVERFGRLDTLFNSVGGSLPDDAPATELDLSVWEQAMTLDLRGTLLTARHAIPAIIASGGGTVVNMSSGAALLGTGRAHAYAAAKGGVNALTRALAGAHAKDNVRVNAICAGRINTERVRAAYGIPGGAIATAASQRGDHFPADQISSLYPFWTGEPDDIASIAVFLASTESRMITGSAIEANGGRSAY